jgi:SAM-dependent methyltransferase
MPQEAKSYLLNTPEALQKEKLRLAKQATVLFELESPILKTSVQTPITSLLDLGCGNAFYTIQLKSLFEAKNVFGYERNESLIEQAQNEFPNVLITRGDLTDSDGVKKILIESQPDIVNLRFVLQHMRPSERAELLKVVRENMKAGATLIVTEPNDSEILFSPPSENLSFLIQRTIDIQAERGGDRNLAGKLQFELNEAGFVSSAGQRYCLNNKDLPVELLKEIILPIWRSYRTNESKDGLDSRVIDASNWLEAHDKKGTLHFEFPIYVFAASIPKQAN